MWYIDAMEFYSAIRKNETTQFEGKMDSIRGHLVN
jgi:hypothetical protein